MSETNPSISVVVPAYRAATTLAEAVASALDQVPRPLEVLIVEDGSDDGTSDVADGLALKAPDILVIRHEGRENRGVAASRNLGVACARGDAVAFLDADDLLLPDALATYTSAFARFQRAGLVYGLAETFGDERPTRLIGRGEPETPAGMLRQFARFNVAAASAVAVRRQTLGSEPFPLRLPLQFEDWACWLRVARSWPVVFVPRPVCKYRVHPGSFLAGLQQGCQMAAYEAAQADFLRAELGGGNAQERRALYEGLAFRTAAALLQATSAVRRGRPGDAARWLRAARRIAGGWVVAATVLPFALRERCRIGRGLDPPLSLDPFPEPAEPHVDPR